MSERIGQILEVLQEVKNHYRPYSDVPELRVAATKTVADRLKINVPTVMDKYNKQLRDDILDTSHFDRLVETWLRGGSMELREALLEHAVDKRGDDKRRINSFFDAGAGAESDKAVADESLITSSQIDEAEAPEPLPRTIITLDDDVAEVFPDSEAVNAALRTLVAIKNLVA